METQEVNGNVKDVVTPSERGKITKMYYIVQRRGKEEKYLSGKRELKADKGSRGASSVPNWTSTKALAQQFSSQSAAEVFVSNLFGPSGFNYLRLIPVKERS